MKYSFDVFLEIFEYVGHGYYLGMFGHFSNLFKLSKLQDQSKVLFTDCCRWLNFHPSLLRLVDRLLFTRRKRLGQKFCHLQGSVNSTLAALI